jgi:hypothetical protein
MLSRANRANRAVPPIGKNDGLAGHVKSRVSGIMSGCSRLKIGLAGRTAKLAGILSFANYC